MHGTEYLPMKHATVLIWLGLTLVPVLALMYWAAFGFVQGSQSKYVGTPKYNNGWFRVPIVSREGPRH